MKKLPENWIETKIENVLEKIVGGGTPSKTNSSFFKGDIPFMTVKDMKKRFPLDTIDHISEEAIIFSATNIVPADTLIVATRMALGKIARPVFPTAINQDLKALFPFDAIDKTYLEYFWRLRLNEIKRLGTGTTVKGIRLDDIASMKIPLAPSMEQKRISDKLDLLVNYVDNCRDRMDNIQRLIKKFRQSVLTSATSGKLTAKWRLEHPINKNIESVFEYLEKNLGRLQGKLRGKRIEEIVALYRRISYKSDSLPNGWANCPVGMIGIVSNGSTPLRAERNFWEGHIPWVSSGEVKNCIIHKSNECISELGFQSTSVRILPVGSVLIAMIGEGKTRGQSAILEIEATINQNIAAVVPFADGLIPKYLWYSFQEKYEENRREGNGTGPQALNCQRVRELTLNLPPLAEQHEIVKRIEALFSFADRLEARLATACTAVDRLTPALLAKAFRGELVPQDSADEPASELLARLAASRAAETAKPRRTRAAKA